jgi:hypothetical protein
MACRIRHLFPVALPCFGALFRQRDYDWTEWPETLKKQKRRKLESRAVGGLYDY